LDRVYRNKPIILYHHAFLISRRDPEGDIHADTGNKNDEQWSHPAHKGRAPWQSKSLFWDHFP
jgi:hypothetical protein